MPVTLILGGARSGKSKRAEALAQAQCLPVVYLATAPIIEDDVDWQQRIAKHRQQRPQHWQCIEEPLHLVPRIAQAESQQQCILLDCATLWLSNLIYHEQDVVAEVEMLCAALAQTSASVLVVSNELGMGLVPEQAVSRHFRDMQGRLNQKLAALAERVEFVVAGLPWVLKEKI